MIDLFDISNLITNYGYIGVFSIVFLESGIFFALPGDSLLFTAGLLASTGYLNLFILIPGIFISTFFGGIVGYYIGVHIQRLRKFNFLNRILKEEYINKAHEFFEKYGRSAILFSRFVPIVRTFTPIVAGIAKMEYKLFLKYSLVSSLLWSIIVTLVGFFLGRIFPQIEHYMSYVIIIVVLLSLAPAIIEMFRKKKD